MRTIDHMRGALATVTLAALMMTAAGGCKLLPRKTDAKKAGLMSIHVYYPEGSNEENSLTLYHYSGKAVHIAPEPLITSRNFKKIVPYKVKDGLGLEIFLDPQGRNIWSQVTSQYYGRRLALVIDGTFRALINIPRSSSTGIFRLTGPFSELEAERLVNFVKHKND